MNLDSAIFYSHSIETLIPFYCNELGFTLEFRLNDKFVSFIFTNGTHLGIKKADEEREKPGYQTALITVDNIHELYESIQRKQIKIYKDITDEDWGTEFSILDPDNNKVEFLQKKSTSH